MSLVTVFLVTSALAADRTGVPTRQIPPSVLNEVRLLENRFELALALDCAPDKCFSKGCTYVAHAVADQPRAGSMPGLGEQPTGDDAAPQEYLTQARCAFAHEKSVSPQDAQALVRRLQSKLSKDWTVVTVEQQTLEELPADLAISGPPPAPEPEPIPAPVPEEPAQLTFAAATAQLWAALLPHFFWMVGLALVTLAAIVFTWTWRRVGRISPEEQALLLQMSQADAGATATTPVAEGADDEAFVRSQSAAWTARLAMLAKDDEPAPEIQTLIKNLLRSGDMALLAKAVLTFPDAFPDAFPSGGDMASAKLELADYLKTVDKAALPNDVDFFTTLNRHALSAALSSQPDAQVVVSLREEFGTAGLAELVGQLMPRPAALLFALAPPDQQHEVVRLLSVRRVAELSTELLRSNRMDPNETSYLFDLVAAVRTDAPLPPTPTVGPSDRGTPFDAAGALSVLLPWLHPASRTALFDGAMERFGGTPPEWVRGVLFADMLFALPDEARADVFLTVDADALAAWLSLLESGTRDALLATMPISLRNAVAATSTFPSRSRRMVLAERGRETLARAFQQQLVLAGIPFERAIGSSSPGRAA
jgi:membrane protein implicated in regulation of membrane protease activity